MDRPNNLEYWINTAKSFSDKNNYKQALEAYEQALTLDPNFVYAWNGKGNALDALGQYREALEAYEEALTLDPNYVYAWYGKGNALDDLGQYREALEAYEQALTLDPNFVYAWNGKGIALRKLGQYREALEAYEQALTLDPNFVYAWNGKGNALDALGQYREALEAYEQALTLDPNFVYAWYGKGIALDDLGQYREALEAYEQALTLDPNFVDAWNGKGNALRKLGQYREALEAYEQALTLDPNFVDAWNGKGNALDALGQYREALEAYEQALTLDPNYVYAWHGKGLVFKNMNNYPESHISFLRVFSMDRRIYFEYSMRSHLQVLFDYQKPAWLQVLFLYVPYLRNSKSWRQLVQQSEELNIESNAIAEIVALSNIKISNKNRIQAALAYYMGNPFRSKHFIEAILQGKNGRWEDYYYLILSLQAFAEPLNEVEEQILTALSHTLNNTPSKNHFYWAGQITYELIPDEIETTFTYFQESEPYLPSYYMQLALINSEIRILTQEKGEIEDETKTHEASNDTNPVEMLQSESRAIEDEIFHWRKEQQRVIEAIYQQEKHIVYGEDWGFIRYITNDAPMLKLGLGEMSTMKWDYVDEDAYLLDQIGNLQEVRKHFWKTARALLKYKTCLEIRPGLHALEEYVIEFPESPIAQFVRKDQLKKKLDTFEAWNILSGKLDNIYQFSEVAFQQQIQNIESEPQLRELRALQATGVDILTILIARIERKTYKDLPNPNTLNHILIYLFWNDEIPKREIVILLMYQYVQKFGTSISKGEKWLKNGVSFIAERFIDYFQVNGIYKILKGLDILDLNDLIDDFMKRVDPDYTIPDYLTFKGQFDEHVSHLKRTMGHDFHLRYPLPEDF